MNIFEVIAGAILLGLLVTAVMGILEAIWGGRK